MPSNKKINVDVGVNFKAEGQQLEQYVNRVKESINAMQGSGGKNSNAFAGTSKALDSLIAEYDKLAKMKLNTDNVGDYIRQQDKLRQAIVAVNQAASKESSDLTTKQAKYNATIDIAKQKQEKLLEAIGKAKAENNSAEVEKLTRSYNAQKGVITRAENGLKALNSESERQKQILSGVNAAVNQANDSLRENVKVQEEAAKAEAEANRQETIDSIKQKIKYYTSLAFGVQLVRRAFRETIETYKELDASITSISMVSGLSRDTLWGQIGTYNDLAKELGTTTGEVLNAAQLYYQQGRDTNSVIELTRESLKLAAIAGLDTAEATNYLTAAVNGYKMEAADAGQVTDVWAQLAAKNAVSVDELAVSISKVASIAQSAGMDIQSTSAFLTQMIATTREAPENLGTALKTIIARFQELKMSGAALEDGVDANKVEKALKTVGISLRDTTGQFRDFDDVILELSSKWDSLDRNTQRYIATIAAGSRQQSRFIALVSDYEGLTKIMGQAADAQGAANEQFEVYTEGLQASLNRLKASWEGFYTSISKGQNLITNIIDLISKIIDGFSKIGVTGTAVILGIGAKITSTLVNVNGIMKAGKGAVNLLDAFRQATPFLSTFIEKFNYIPELTGPFSSIVNGAHAAGTAFDAAASSTLGFSVSISTLLPWLAGIAVVIGAITFAYQAYKKWEKKPEEWKEEAQNSQQVAKRYEEYADSIEEAVKAGKDWSDIRERLLAENDEFLKDIDAENLSTQELIEKLRERQKLEEQKAVIKKAAAQQEENRRSNDYANAQNYDVFTENYNTTGNFQPIEQKQLLDLSTAKRLAENAEDLFKGVSFSALGAEASINALTYGLAEFGFQYDETTGKVTQSFEMQEYLDFISNLSPQLQEAFNQMASGVSAYDINRVDSALLEQLQNTFSGTEFESVITNFIEEGNKLGEAITGGFTMAFDNTSNPIAAHLLNGLKDNEAISGEIQQSILDIFNHIDPEDSEAQQAFLEYVESILAVDPELLTQDVLAAWGDMDLMTNLFNGLLNSSEDVDVDFMDAIKDQLGEVNSAFLEGLDAVNDYNAALGQLDKMTSGGNLQEYSAMVDMLSADYAELGYATEDACRAAIWANSIHDETGNYMLAEGSYLDMLRQKYFDNAEAQRQEGIAALNTAKEKLEANLVTIDGAIQEAQALLKKAKQEIAADGQVSTQTLQSIEKQSGAWDDLVKNTLNPILKSAGMPAIGSSKISTNASSSSGASAIAALESQISAMQNARGQVVAAINSIQSMTNQLTVPLNTGASSGGRGGGGGSGSKSTKESTKETEKLSKAMEAAAKAAKELAKEMQDAAKAEIAAAKERLKVLKEEVEKSKKAREDALEASRKHNKIYFEELKDAYEDWLKNQADAIDKAKEKEKELEDARDDDNDRLNDWSNAVQDAYDLQIDGIQAKIDALDKEAEAEDRLRKLQEARDAYERSRNQRTRLVLTQGAGWIFKTDTEALNQARDGLKNAQRDYQKAVLQDEIDKIQEQKDKWAEVAENIGKTTDELKKYDDLLLEAKELLKDGDVEAALSTFRGEVTANNAKAQAVEDQKAIIDALEKQYEADEIRIDAITEKIDKILDMIDWDAEDIADEIYRQNKRAEINRSVNDNKTLDSIEDAFNKRGGFNDFAKKFLGDYDKLGSINLDDSTNLAKLFEIVGGHNLEQLYGIEQLEKKLEDIEKQEAAWDKLGENIGKTTEEIQAAKAIQEKYGNLTLEQLTEGSNIFKSMDHRINDKWLTDIDTTKDNWFDAVKTAAENNAIGIVELADYLKIYNDQIEDQKAREEEEKNIAAAQGGSSGGSTGSAVSNNYNSGGGNYTPTLSPSSDPTNSSNKPKTFITADKDVARKYAINHDVTPIKIANTTANAGGINTSGNTSSVVYNFQISTNANNVNGVISDAKRYSNVRVPMTK